MRDLQLHPPLQLLSKCHRLRSRCWVIPCEAWRSTIKVANVNYVWWSSGLQISIIGCIGTWWTLKKVHCTDHRATLGMQVNSGKGGLGLTVFVHQWEIVYIFFFFPICHNSDEYWSIVTIVHVYLTIELLSKAFLIHQFTHRLKREATSISIIFQQTKSLSLPDQCQCQLGAKSWSWTRRTLIRPEVFDSYPNTTKLNWKCWH